MNVLVDVPVETIVLVVRGTAVEEVIVLVNTLVELVVIGEVID